ncbi:hypothetical protein M758_5G081700 [Ceratodon purpureus]|nr:hypothetical protein M758_5G081700 [Ceratodon purpureus]
MLLASHVLLAALKWEHVLSCGKEVIMASLGAISLTAEMRTTGSPGSCAPEQPCYNCYGRRWSVAYGLGFL